MIEGTQLGSIQFFFASPEFFVGVDQRFELLRAAGLSESQQHAIRIISDPEFALGGARTAEEIGTIVTPGKINFSAQQRKSWVESGEIDVLSTRRQGRDVSAPSATTPSRASPTQPLWDLLRADREAQPVGRRKYE